MELNTPKQPANMLSGKPTCLLHCMFLSSLFSLLHLFAVGVFFWYVEHMVSSVVFFCYCVPHSLSCMCPSSAFASCVSVCLLSVCHVRGGGIDYCYVSQTTSTQQWSQLLLLSAERYSTVRLSMVRSQSVQTEAQWHVRTRSRVQLPTLRRARR